MARPNSKGELEIQCLENYNKLLGFIDSIPSKWSEREFPEGTLNRNVSDVLAHLHHWHLMMLKWYEVGMAGEKPKMPAEGFTWKTLPDLNRLIHRKYQNTSVATVKIKFVDSHRVVSKLIEMHTNVELFEKKHYFWTGSTSLGAYLISATSSHYDWALKLIKKATKEW